MCGVERSLRAWLDARHRFPVSTTNRAALENLTSDLRRQADALDVEQPLLVVMLMGGTGVGKSTLLNALAGGGIAQASFQRPTTRDPVVYYHESVRTDRLDPALRHCRLAPHDRVSLQHKIIVDTPDLDSTVVANRDKLLHILPVADIVLYVGSQEKYHDEIGWKLFLEQRRRRAFAFVLNKWDRCVHAGASGLRPDDDLLRDLTDEGFKRPVIFRTCAQKWVDLAPRSSPLASSPARPPDLPEGEQFEELMQWLELGITKLEVDAIKARGVTQLLTHLQEVLTAACPPDLTEVAAKTSAAWTTPLQEETTATTDVLLDTLEPFQREIEHHFALEGQRRFRGIMAWYLQLFTRAKYIGSTLTSRIPFLPRIGGSNVETPSAWDLAKFTRDCSEAASSRQLDARNKALANRLLVEADRQGFPLAILSDPVEALAKLDWRQRYTLALNQVLHHVEQQWTRPTGARRVIQTLLVWAADWLPLVALLASLIVLLWRYFNVIGDQLHIPTLQEWLVPLLVMLSVVIILHLLIALLLPLRWPAIRGEFRRELQKRVQQELEKTYRPLPGELAQALKEEREQVQKLIGEVREVSGWLEQREQSATIAGLYGKLILLPPFSPVLRGSGVGVRVRDSSTPSPPNPSPEYREGGGRFFERNLHDRRQVDPRSEGRHAAERSGPVRFAGAPGSCASMPPRRLPGSSTRSRTRP